METMIRNGREIPVFEVTPTKNYKRKPYKRVYLLSFICPNCGKENFHGGVWGQKGAVDGHRESHCRCWMDTGGYFIKEK